MVTYLTTLAVFIEEFLITFTDAMTAESVGIHTSIAWLQTLAIQMTILTSQGCNMSKNDHYEQTAWELGHLEGGWR